ncbi:MAG: hypothetical protein ABDH21_01630 [bacterium]
MEIFIGTAEIAGHYIRLCKALQKINVKANYYCKYHPFEYSSINDYPNILAKLLYLLTKYKYLLTRSKRRILGIISIKRFTWFCFNILIVILELIILLYSIWKYQVFIFTFGESILPFNLDLPILKFFKKKIIFSIFHGSEARPTYIDLYGLDLSQKEKTLEKAYQMMKIKSYKIKMIEKYSDYIVSNYFISQLLTRKYVDYHHIGLMPPNIKVDNSDNTITDKIKILHAPSKPESKGTDKIRQVIQKLSQKYKDIQYIEIHGKPYQEVINHIKQCDFIVDQLYSDVALTGLATEGAILGKPSIMGGYIWEKYKQIHPPSIIPPSHLCHPDEIEQAIEFMINNKEYREELGQKAQEFILSNWSEEKIAEKFLMIINDQVPEEWYREPVKDYAHFAIIDQKIAKEFLKEYINKYGDKALFLDHKPSLKQAFLNLIQS